MLWIISILITACIAICKGDTNVAHIDSGATCTASLEGLHACDRAMDGVAMTTSAAFKWDFIGDPVGEWIQIEFARTEQIGFIRIMEGWYGDNKAIKEVELAFSDGSTQQVTLLLQEDGYLWEEFDLIPVETDFVRLTILSSYGGHYNIIAEIEVYNMFEATTALPRSSSKVDSKGLDTDIILYAAIGGGALVLLVIVLSVALCRRRKHEQTQEDVEKRFPKIMERLETASSASDGYGYNYRIKQWQDRLFMISGHTIDLDDDEHTTHVGRVDTK